MTLPAVDNPLRSRLLFLRALATYAEPTLAFDDTTASLQQGATGLVFLYQSESARLLGKPLEADLLQRWTTCSLARALVRHGDSLLEDAQADLAARLAFRDLNLRAVNWSLYLVQALACFHPGEDEPLPGAARLLLAPRGAEAASELPPKERFSEDSGGNRLLGELLFWWRSLKP